MKAQSISAYLSTVQHLQVSAGLNLTIRSQWPGLQYVLRGVRRSQDSAPQRVRLPITVAIMCHLQEIWACSPASMQYDATMLWATACIGYFGFMKAREFTMTDPTEPLAIQASDVAVDSHATHRCSGCCSGGLRRIHMATDYSYTWQDLIACMPCGCYAWLPSSSPSRRGPSSVHV